jgi:hypothetical protein
VETLELASPALASFVPFSVLRDAGSKELAVKVRAGAGAPRPFLSALFTEVSRSRKSRKFF